jgi:hypothetical protein
MAEPRTLVAGIEAGVSLPRGREERFSGYGVMGLTFASGHVLAMRRFPVTSIGPGYTSIWHRDPDGGWAMYQDVEPRMACPRFFGSALVESYVRDITIEWPGPHTLSVTIPGQLSWEMTLGSSPAIALMNAMAALMPDALWRIGAVLKLMAAVGGPLLGAGRLRLAGRAPNGQAYIANPQRVWSISRATAVLGGVDLGPAGPLREQAMIGDFYIPQRGMFAIGRAFFEPFDAARHLAATSQVERAS